MNKKFYIIQEGKVLCGVCNGIAEYINFDVTIVRALYLLGCFCFPPLVIIYFVIYMIAPSKEHYAKKVKEAKIVNEKDT